MRVSIAMLAAAIAAGPALAKDVPPEVEFGMPSRDLGKAEGRCRPGETGPALMVTVTGLKDRGGLLRLELYPDNEDDFLASDKVLKRAGKMFHRVEQPVPPSGPVELCIRTPGPGNYSLSVLHDRDANRKFGLSTDGVGFGSNPKLSLSKPKAAMARVVSTGGVSEISVRMNYRRGLFSFGPLKKR
ncbi:DUF2141 domain-containing protein [Sandarakinorhabdus glacialis]|nr:DUF2141 domain-containing protein [Polymorphobacter glacialis]